MHGHDLSAWTHQHRFDAGSRAAERGTRIVVAITLAMMVVEIGAGWGFNSMALLADGWHMSTHAFAIGLAAFAYAAARRHGDDPRFAFGTWKIEILGGYSSALFLFGVAALMVWESMQRLLAPQPIQYREAILVAVVGLAVNIVCALVLRQSHDHHGHQEHVHEDLNLKAAYLHVLADAATSVLAVVALLCGMLLGWSWLDPAMGVAGALLIALWARGLAAQTGRVLLDREMDHPVVAEIRREIEADPARGDNRVIDLHVWRVGRDAYACALSILTHDPALTAGQVREWLGAHAEIAHLTIEIRLCPDTEN